MKKITFINIFTFLVLVTNSISAQSTATYDITFQSTWNSTDHGTLPANAHWSDLVGANHNSNITFLEIGAMASPGIESVAEDGSNGSFNSEVLAEINAGNAEQWLQKPVDPFNAIASASLNDIIISEDFPLITLASMIAPSPDWMIAVNSLNLWDTSNNKWKESFTIDLYPYDAGTEEGLNYAINNAETNPQGLITNVAGATGYPFGPNKIGTLTITFKSTTLSTQNFDNITNVRLYPNPNYSGELTIQNTNTLSKISIYDILGKKVKQIELKNSTQNIKTINVSDLKEGIYIVQLKDINGDTESKKLILN